MGLNLDLRQRAMLLEMGVQVWLPQTPVTTITTVTNELVYWEAPCQALIKSESTHVAHPEGLSSSRHALPQPQPQPPTPIEPSPTAEALNHSAAVWKLGPAQWLYPEKTPLQALQAPQTQSPNRWLVLAQTPPTALPNGILADFSAFEGQAGQLLDNMLRAAQRHQQGLTWLAPLVRQGTGTAAATAEFLATLMELIGQIQPDLVLIMGRLASQSLLPNERFDKLRGHVQALHGQTTLVTYDAPYLLRTPSDKAKAWADLCLAIQLTTPTDSTSPTAKAQIVD